MYDTPERLVERLSSEGEKTQEFFSALLPGQWERTLYTDGGRWSVRQVLAHLVGAEVGMRQLMENILAGSPGVPEDFDLDAYNERRVERLDNVPADELLQRFTAQRQVTIDFVSCLEVEDLRKSGRHPFLGKTSLEDIVKLMYRHNQIHQRDVRKLLTSSER